MRLGKSITLIRYAYIKGKRTLGSLYLTSTNMTGKGWICWTMEPNRDISQENVPKSDTAIPAGAYSYLVVLHPKFPKGPILKLTALNPQVKRDGLLMHPGNHDTDTLGCPLPGLTKNKEGEVFNSVAAMQRVIELITEKTVVSEQIGVPGILTIKDEDKHVSRANLS